MSEKSGVISEVSKQGGRYQRLGPVIVNFEHGDVDPVAFGELKAGLSYEFPDRRESSRDGVDPNLSVYVKTDQLTYSNMTRSAREVRPNPYTKTLLAIRNKVTNQVRLIETNCVTVSGEVRFPKSSNTFLIEESSKRKSIIDSDDIAEAMLEHRTMAKRHLVREFGQTKGRRLAEQSERMKIDVALKQEKLRTVAENVDESLLFLPEQSKPNELTPPCNKKAIRVEDVYKLEDILASHELDVLEEAAKIFLEEINTPELIDQAVQENEITEVFAAALKRQLQIGDDRVAGASIYMEAILQYLMLRPGKISQGPRGLPNYIPFAIRQKVFDMFVPNMLVSQENNDRAFCHALVLAFLTNNYNIEMQRLAASIKIRASLMKKLIMVTGATIRTDVITRQSFVTLKLPLTRFDPSMSFKKKKKD